MNLGITIYLPSDHHTVSRIFFLPTTLIETLRDGPLIRTINDIPLLALCIYCCRQSRNQYEPVHTTFIWAKFVRVVHQQYPSSLHANLHTRCNGNYFLCHHHRGSSVAYFLHHFGNLLYSQFRPWRSASQSQL